MEIFHLLLALHMPTSRGLSAASWGVHWQETRLEAESCTPLGDVSIASSIVATAAKAYLGILSMSF